MIENEVQVDHKGLRNIDRNDRPESIVMDGRFALEPVARMHWKMQLSKLCCFFGKSIPGKVYE